MLTKFFLTLRFLRDFLLCILLKNCEFYQLVRLVLFHIHFGSGVPGSGSVMIFSGSGSGQNFRIRPDPDPQPWFQRLWDMTALEENRERKLGKFTCTEGSGGPELPEVTLPVQESCGKPKGLKSHSKHWRRS